MKELLWPFLLLIKKLKYSSIYPQQLDNLLNIDNPYFEGMVGRIYPSAQKLNKANASDTEAQFFGLTFYYLKRIFVIQNDDKRDCFDFDIAI